MHILRVYGHICTKYEVSVFKPVDRRPVHRPQHPQQHMTEKYDGIGSIGIIPNEPKLS